MNCHSYQELIALYLEQDLPADEAGRVEEHLSGCEGCKQFAEQLKRSQAALKGLQDDPGDDPLYLKMRRNVLAELESRSSRQWLPAWWSWKPVLITALLASVAAAGVIVLSIKTPDPSAPSTAKQEEPEPPVVRELEKVPESADGRASETEPSSELSVTGKVDSPGVAGAQQPQNAKVIVQQKDSVIYGRVVDDWKQPLPGVRVALGSDQQPDRITITNHDGEFRFSGLEQGTYHADFVLEGFQELRIEDIRLAGGVERQLAASISSTMSEEFKVISDTSVVDAKKTGGETTFTQEYLAGVPAGRDPWVIIDEIPGVGNDRTNVAGSESGQQTRYYARGPSASEKSEAKPDAPSEEDQGWRYDGGKSTEKVNRGSTTATAPPQAKAPPPPTPASQPPTAERPAIPPPAPAMPAEVPAPAIQTTVPPASEPSPDLPQRELKTADNLLIFAKKEKRRRLERYGQTVDAEEEPATQGTLRARSSEGEILGEFPLQHTEVRADISGYLAQTVVEQLYTNPHQEPIEAVYVFPLPVMSAVNDFVMEIGDRRIVGIVRPREEAERIYREARERGQTASLLTQERPNMFTQNVANIEPGGEVRIRITYFERLDYEDGYYSYVFPMVVGPRYIPGNPQATAPGSEPGGGWSAPTDQVLDADKITPPVLKPGERSGHDIGVTVHLDAGFPVRDLQVITHKLDVREEGPSRRVLKLIESDSIPNRDLVLRWSVAGDETQFGLLTHRSEYGGFFTLMLQPPLEPADALVSPREITFIMDISGSMSGIPVEMSKQIVSRTLDRLRAEDIFNIFFFASGNGQLWETPQANTPENIATAKAFMTSMRGRGGTEMMAGVRRALNGKHDPKYLQMYAFLTDGFVGNEEAILRIVKEERGAARFFAFGIGSSVNRYLIDGIGEHGGGTSHVVIPRDRNHALRAVEKFFDCIDSPVLVDIEMDWNKLPVTDVYPHEVRDLFAGQTISVIGRFTKPAKGKMYVLGRVGARRLRYEVKVTLPKKEKQHAALAPVWARNKIHDLSSRMLSASPDARAEFVQQITNLAVTHRLVSQYTAFVAVDESRIVGDGKPLRILQPVEMPEGVSYEGVFGEHFVGEAMQISAWGLVLQMTESGKIRVVSVQGVAASSGVRVGTVLKSINRVLVKDMRHLEGLLLQSSRSKIQIEFEPGGRILLPIP